VTFCSARPRVLAMASAFVARSPVRVSFSPACSRLRGEVPVFRQEAKASSAISIMETSSLLIAFAAASTSGRTCLMKYRAVATFPS